MMASDTLDEYELHNSSQELPLFPRQAKADRTRLDVRAVYDETEEVPFLRPWSVYFALAALSLTTTLSILVFASNASDWRLDSDLYFLITNNRASVQLVVQVLSNVLGLIYTSVICVLIDHATRIYLGKHAATLQSLRLWHALCTRNVNWGYPWKLVTPVLLFVALTATPSAIWAGALTPVISRTTSQVSVLVASYSNDTFVHEWPSEINAQGPSLRNNKGLFTYSVGVQMQGSLLASASSATPVDGSVRQHQKFDYTQHTYFGRSYGAGAPVGLLDDNIANDPLALEYSYQEIGYKTSVDCVYNASSDFHLEPNGPSPLYVATGLLPNSGSGGPEWSRYFGYTTDAIVAIGVGRDPADPRRILAIAAGKSYAHLDGVQCTIGFAPARLNVTVGISQRNITVTPDAMLEPPTYDSASAYANLTQALTRQFELIANDQTNLYVSLVGSSLNASIADYITAKTANGPSISALTLREATLPGLENAFTAMADDMLVAYNSAQLMVADQKSSTPAVVTSTAMRIGQNAYVYATFVINLVVLLLVIVEGIRTRGWRRLVALEYTDPAALIIASAQSDQTDPQWVGNMNRMASKDRVKLGPRMSLSLVESNVVSRT